MPWGALVGAVVGGGLSYAGSQKANKTQQQAIDEQRRQFELMRGDTSAYKDIGKSALNRLSDLYGLDRAFDSAAPTREQFTSTSDGSRGSFYNNADPAHQFALRTLPGFGKKYKDAPKQSYFDEAGYNAATAKYNQDLDAFNHRERGAALFQKDPGYEFRLNQGIQNLDRSANARGVGMSGGAIKELDRYNQDYASNEFTNYANRLSALAGIGQTATNASAQLGQSNANNISSLYQGMGNNYMSSYAGMNNAIQGGLGNYAFMNYLKQKPSGGGNGGYYGGTDPYKSDTFWNDYGNNYG